jgi:putative intracellular protease/amidase
MKVAFVIYPDFTALDLVGPYEVISRWQGAEVHFVSSSTDPVRCDSGLTVLPTDTPSTLPDPDLIVVSHGPPQSARGQASTPSPA